MGRWTISAITRGITTTVLMTGFLTACGGNESATRETPTMQDRVDALNPQQTADTSHAAPAGTSPEEAYAMKFDEASSALPECKGLDKYKVKAFHKRRNEGLSGSVLTGDDNLYLYCDYKIRLMAEGRTEYQGM